MASRAARRSPNRGPRLFEDPVFFLRTRRDLGELMGLVWLGLEVVRLVRSRFDKPRG